MAERDEEQFLDDLEDIEADIEAALDDEAELTPEQIIEELKAERDSFQDKFMRALADAENARKRAQKDRMEAENYGGSKLSRDMLP
ncbi:MAG: nucleotide exchange factor GrpE, partial [Pseudomonadota bacterium]